MGASVYNSNFIKNWGCGVTIRVAGPGAAGTAINAWNQALRASILPGLPVFEYTTDTMHADVRITTSGGGPDWCGATPTPDHIILTGKTASTCPSNWSDMGTTLVHEFGHVLGFQAGFDGLLTTPSNCTMHLKPGPAINGYPCQDEIEYVYAAYGFTSLDVTNFWGRPVVTRLALAPTSMTLGVGSKQRDSVTTVYLDHQIVSPSSYPASAVSVTWTTADGTVAGVTPDGLAAVVAGAQPGQTSIHATVTGTSIPNALLGTLARLVGDSVAVTVPEGSPPPPPGSGFRVSGVSGPSTPIKAAGNYSLNVTVVNQPGPDLYLRWQVSYSNGVLGPYDTGFRTGPSYYLNVPAGSYSITVTVTPRSNSLNGTPYTATYPVCTGGTGGGGGGDLVANAELDALAQPNAVTGC